MTAPPHIEHNVLTSWQKFNDLLPVCQDVLNGPDILLPRAEPRGYRVLTETGQDVWHVFLAGATPAWIISQKHGCHVTIVKAKSPSRGFDVVYSGVFASSHAVTTEALLSAGIQVSTEHEILKAYEYWKHLCQK
ncbi:MAG: DUF523 domain-containing protein [Gammaproteobacteria bacterium]|nr:MAG: DUF523 domain-containing protein [Gammaproteobacteria bacterium]